MSFSNRPHRGAPTTIFASKQLSPRQIATKALTLGCKKLDRDDKRSRPLYNVRERLLLCNTIANAEEVLNKRKGRTNRRVMSAEEEEHLFESNLKKKKEQNNKKNHHEEHASPLRASSSDEEDEEDQVENNSSSLNNNNNNNSNNSESITSTPTLSPSTSLSSISSSKSSSNNNTILKSTNDHHHILNSPNTLNQPNDFVNITPENDYRKLVKQHPMISPIAAL